MMNAAFARPAFAAPLPLIEDIAPLNSMLVRLTALRDNPERYLPTWEIMVRSVGAEPFLIEDDGRLQLHMGLSDDQHIAARFLFLNALGDDLVESGHRDGLRERLAARGLIVGRICRTRRAAPTDEPHDEGGDDLREGEKA